MSVHCLFRIDSDGCSYSFESLIGVFTSQETATTGLLRYVEIQEKKNADASRRNRLSGHSTNPDDYTIQECELDELINDDYDTDLPSMPSYTFIPVQGKKK